MQLTVLQEPFKKALSAVLRAIPAKSTYPVLSNVLMVADQGKLKLSGTDFSIGITCWIDAEIEAPGAVTVPAKLLSDIVGGLPSAPIALSLDSRCTLTLNCAQFEADLKGIDAEEFPTIPHIEDAQPLATIPADVFCTAIQQVAFAAADDTTRPVLAGVLLRLADQSIGMIATDGYRLASRHIGLSEPLAEPMDLIVPGNALAELSRIIGDGSVSITVTPNNGLLSFRNGDIELNSRLIEGKFPDFMRFIPPGYTTRMVVNTQELTRAVKLANHFAASAANIIKLAIDANGQAVVTINAADVGKNRSIVNGAVEGEPGQIALNIKLLLEALGTVATSQVAVEIQNEAMPTILRPIGDDHMFQLVMPMTVRGK